MTYEEAISVIDGFRRLVYTDDLEGMERSDFGEDIDGIKAAIVSPAVYAEMRKNTNTWVPASELAAEIAIRGVVGEFQGCQVMVSNKLTSSKDIYIRDKRAIKTAIEALEKQIPKKPYQKNEISIEFCCPSCRQICGYFDCMAWETPKFCCECGQALDWSDADEA